MYINRFDILSAQSSIYVSFCAPYIISIPTEYKNCIVIPQSATYELQNKVFTWKVVDGKTQSTPITVYKYNDGQTYIVLSGLQTGDVIIAEGAGLMREGTAVNVTSTSEPEK